MALLLFINVLSFCAAITRSSTNDPIVRATAFAQGKSTLLAQQAQTVTAIVRAEEGTDSDKIIGYYPQNPQVKVGAPFSIYVIVQNTGTSAWSDARGYWFACVPPQGSQSDPDCQNASVSGFIGGTLAHNQTYVLLIKLTAAKPGQHQITLSLTHNSHFFLGSQQIAKFFVQGK